MASELRHYDVSRSTDAAAGQTWPVGSTGQWLGLVSAADVGAQSTATSARSKLTRGATAIRLNLIYFS